MMLNYEKLVKKILDVWKKYDNQEISIENLRKEFTPHEIYTILYDENILNDYYEIIDNFQNKISNLTNFFYRKRSRRSD